MGANRLRGWPHKNGAVYSLALLILLSPEIALGQSSDLSGDESNGSDQQHMVQLGAFHSPESARRLWSALASNHGERLQSLEPCIASPKDPSVDARFYRLQVGPFATRAAAASTCKDLKSEGIDCLVSQEISGARCIGPASNGAADTPSSQQLVASSGGLASARSEHTAQVGSEQVAAVSSPAPEGSTEISPSATATREATDQTDGGTQFDVDDPPETRYRLVGRLWTGSRLETEFEHRDDLDLDPDVDDQLTTLDPLLKIAFNYAHSSRGFAFLQFNLGHRFQLESPPGTPHPDTRLLIERAYVGLRDVAPGVSLQFGRQRFDDEREWYFDEKLDAARVFFGSGRLQIDLSVSREDLIRRDLLSSDKENPINNYFAVARYGLDDDWELDGFLLFRDDRSSRKLDRKYLGIRSIGELTSRIDHWFDAALLLGRNRDRSIRAFALDAGATYVFKAPARPAITLGFAMGSGDDNRGDNIDREFRQTGLEDNSDKFSGVTSFKYYGEALDPELRNLKILTVGAGIRPIKHGSIDIVYHSYSQHAVDDDLDSELEVDPNGRNRDIGQAIDLILGYRGVPNWSFEFILGVFWPGDAFDSPAKRSDFAAIEARHQF